MPSHDVLAPGRSGRWRSRAGCRRPCRRRPARRWAISRAPRRPAGTMSATASAATKPSSAARARRAVGPQDRRAVEIAGRRGPGAAAAAPAAGLLARPHDGAFGRAGIGQARGLVVGAADAVERDQRPPVRQDGRGTHGNRPLAAAAATRLSGCGASENTATRTRRDEGHGAVDAERPAGRAPRPARRNTSP